MTMDMALPIEKFSDRFLHSAINELALSIKYGSHGKPVVFYELELPGGVDMASRATNDELSIRVVRAYDITEDRFPTRFDVIFEYA